MDKRAQYRNYSSFLTQCIELQKQQYLRLSSHECCVVNAIQDLDFCAHDGYKPSLTTWEVLSWATTDFILNGIARHVTKSN